LCILGYDILDVNCSPRESMVRGSAAQIADGKIILFTVNSVLILSVLRAHNPDASLEHSTSLTPHYAVPWTTAIDFRSAKHTASPHAVSLVARQNPPPERWNSRDSSRQHYLSLPLEGTRRFYDVKSLADHRTTRRLCDILQYINAS